MKDARFRSLDTILSGWIASRHNRNNQRGVLRNTTEVTVQPPESTDGYELNRLIANSPPLDSNSVYCNLLQCNHFQNTCICAKSDGKLIGFVSGYLLPAHPDTLFVWQVVVDEQARGQGLAGRMLKALLDQPACRNVDFTETTITADNKASQALFTKLAETLSTDVQILPGFDKAHHFHGEHASEELWRIGPITQRQRGSQNEDI